MYPVVHKLFMTFHYRSIKSERVGFGDMFPEVILVQERTQEYVFGGRVPLSIKFAYLSGADGWTSRNKQYVVGMF